MPDRTWAETSFLKLLQGWLSIQGAPVTAKSTIPPEALLLAKWQWQLGISNLKLSELDKDLRDLVQPAHLTE